MPRGEFGNTVEFALGMLRNHWKKKHEDGWPGGDERPYRCEVCRALWMRASATITPHAPVPIPYVEVVQQATGEKLEIRFPLST